MRLAFRSVVAFNVATALWLSMMFLILRHEQFARNAVITLGVAAFCALAFLSARTGAPAWMRMAALIGSVAMAVFGAWTVHGQLQPNNLDFEGYLLIIGASWVAQGAGAGLMFRSPGAGT